MIADLLLALSLLLNDCIYHPWLEMIGLDLHHPAVTAVIDARCS